MSKDSWHHGHLDGYDPKKKIKACVVCGFPERGDLGVQLYRFTWVDDETAPTFSITNIHGEPVDYRPMKIAVATEPKRNDVLVCKDCIEGLKRIPFSELDKGRDTDC